MDNKKVLTAQVNIIKDNYNPPHELLGVWNHKIDEYINALKSWKKSLKITNAEKVITEFNKTNNSIIVNAKANWNSYKNSLINTLEKREQTKVDNILLSNIQKGKWKCPKCQYPDNESNHVFIKI